MKITIIGAGNVGQTLGTALRSKGHTVIYGSRSPASHSERNVRSIAEALIGAEVVILATPWIATEALVVQHADGLASKIVIDATNPIHPVSRGSPSRPTARASSCCKAKPARRSSSRRSTAPA